MRRRLRNLASSVAILVALCAVAILTMSYLPNFGLPSPSNSNGLFSGPPLGSPKNGTLVIQIEINVSSVASTQLPYGSIAQPSLRDYPLSGVSVKVTDEQNASNSFVINSDSRGTIETSLRPSIYLVKFLDWRLNYSAMSVNVNSGGKTTVYSLLNATSYPVASYYISDPNSLGWAVSWEPAYLYTQGNMPKVGSTVNYLAYTNLSPSVTLTKISPSGIVEIKISSIFALNNSTWVGAQIMSPVPISSLGSLQILALDARYVVTS